MRKILYIIIIAVLLALLIWGNGFLRYKFEASDKVHGFLDALYGKSVLLDRIAILEKENAELKTDKLLSDTTPAGTFKVYSTYPENNLRELVIAGGYDRNIKVGSVVTYGEKILLGEITSVYSTWSVARTIFDPNETIKVRIGEKEIDGLLKGGNTPTVTLIKKGAEVKAGDIVFSADQKAHYYGLEVGTVKDIIDDQSQQFRSATVQTTIQFSDIKNVSIRP